MKPTVPAFLYQNLMNVLSNHLCENKGVVPKGQYIYGPYEDYCDYPRKIRWYPGMPINEDTYEAFDDYIRGLLPLEPYKSLHSLLYDLHINENRIAVYKRIKSIVQE